MSYYPPGSPMRMAAEKIMKAHDAKVPMREIAKRQHLSVPTVRRIINNLELSRQIESGEVPAVILLPPLAQSRSGEAE
jgi:hypothetical protein